MKRIRTVGVIGAGIAGLACAQRLQASGLRVTVLEKSRGLGGRVATRRIDSVVTFDHGAQYFTVRDATFGAEVKRWCAAGAAALWSGRIVSLNRGLVDDLREPQNRYVGVPGMSAIAKSLALGLHVQATVTAQSICRSDDIWQVEDALGSLYGPFDLLISTAPPPQTQALFGHLSKTLDEPISSVTMAPCWTVMLQLRDPLQVPYDAAFVHNSPLNWIARNSNKPGRGCTDCWILQATAEWSRDYLEESADAIERTLIEHFWQATEQPPQPLEFMAAHRWRYALPLTPLSQRFLLDRDLNLGACGDWCGGPRIEGAFLSGLAMADAVLEAW